MRFSVAGRFRPPPEGSYVGTARRGTDPNGVWRIMVGLSPEDHDEFGRPLPMHLR